MDYVVCVDDNFPQRNIKEFRTVIYPVKGKVYSIREAFTYEGPGSETGAQYRLNEIINTQLVRLEAHTLNRAEPCFAARRFRPITRDLEKVFTGETLNDTLLPSTHLFQ